MQCESNFLNNYFVFPDMVTVTVSLLRTQVQVCVKKSEHKQTEKKTIKIMFPLDYSADNER